MAQQRVKEFLAIGQSGNLQPSLKYYNSSLWDKYLIISLFAEENLYPQNYFLSEALVKGVLQHSPRAVAKSYPVMGVRKQRPNSKILDEVYILKSLLNEWGRIRQV